MHTVSASAGQNSVWQQLPHPPVTKTAGIQVVSLRNSKQRRMCTIRNQSAKRIIGYRTRKQRQNQPAAFVKTNRQYIIRSSREVAFCYERFGTHTVQQYISQDVSYCFDDLGLEQLKLDTEVIKKLLQFRLLNAADNTHISTRLDKAALVEKYGKDFTELLYRKLNHIEFTNSFNL